MANDGDVIGRLTKRLRQRVILDDADAEYLGGLSYTIRRYAAGEYILREGDEPRHSLFLLDGFVFRHTIVVAGGRQIVAIHLPEDFLDLQNVLLQIADHNVQALTATTVAAFDVDHLLDMASARPMIGRALWRESLIEASIYREWVANIGRRDARTRTAHLLCELAIRREQAGLGPRDKYELPMTQEQLGDALGLTAVHVNRTLKTLQDEGLITRNKRSVTIADWDRLRNAAEFTTGYLHLDQMTDPARY